MNLYSALIHGCSMYFENVQMYRDGSVEGNLYVVGKYLAATCLIVG
jgi:hypothetical protein